MLIDLGLFVPEVLVGPDDVPAGSVHAIAPEVLLGEVRPGHGPQVDLYALGVLAFELLTGTFPYEAPFPEGVLAKHVAAPIPDPRERRADVPPALACLVRELLAKDPDDRPPSAEAVLWQLKELRGGGALRACPTTVLVVDDDPSVGRALTLCIERAYPQLRVRSTTDPEAALPVEGRAPADVVVLDLDMPRINGVELCMALRGLPASVRPGIVAMSGSAGAEDVDLLRELGAATFVPKDAALFAAVGHAVARLRCGEASSEESTSPSYAA